MSLLLTAWGCDAGNDGTVCTTIFSYQSALVVDATGAPFLAAWTVTDTVRRTGKALVIAQQGYPSGAATIFSDTNLNDVRAAGDSVRVTGVGGGKTFGAWYQFGSAGGCHIQRISGPDMVVAR